jgi:hypothetical protein
MEPSMALESFIYQMDRERREYSRIMFIWVVRVMIISHNH